VTESLLLYILEWREILVEREVSQGLMKRIPACGVQYASEFLVNFVVYQEKMAETTNSWGHQQQHEC
jgi:hypothetical protein